MFSPPRYGRTPQGVRGLKLIDGTIYHVRGCRTPQGVRGLKYYACLRNSQLICRTPQGVRGLKYIGFFPHLQRRKSHPARGAWIEISGKLPLSPYPVRRTPQGVRGLKCLHIAPERDII